MVGVDRVWRFWKCTKRADRFERGDKRSDGEDWASERRWISQDTGSWCVGIGGCEGGAMNIHKTLSNLASKHPTAWKGGIAYHVITALVLIWIWYEVNSK